MTELADQELSGRLPVKVVQEVELFLDYGYYTDERGIKRFGVIPKKQNNEIYIRKEEYDDPYRIESSDPRVYERALRDGIRW